MYYLVKCTCILELYSRQQCPVRRRCCYIFACVQNNVHNILLKLIIILRCNYIVQTPDDGFYLRFYDSSLIPPSPQKNDRFAKLW